MIMGDRKFESSHSEWHCCGAGRWLNRCAASGAALLSLGIIAALTLAASGDANAPAPAPSNTRELFNAGTRNLRGGKLQEAEALLESTVASQNTRLQPDALYNLGHVRFSQGIEELKKGPPAGPTKARGQAAAEQADSAIHSADQALQQTDLQTLVAAYQRGRGARKELKAARAAVKKAMEAHQKTMAKWMRASGDFRSTTELVSNNSDAAHNADVVDRCIARLADMLQELQAMANAMGQKQQDLGEKMKQLKGKMPNGEMPGGAGDDEEDEDSPFGLPPGQKEGPSKEGEQQQMTLTAEQAGWLLEGYKLDSERRLPMGQGQEAQPKDRNRPDW